MKDPECTPFLQWALPRLGLFWPGFRKVRGQVCKRLGRRLRELGLSQVSEYRARLESDPDEWAVLESLCSVTISRFYRDPRVFELLEQKVLPALAEAAAARGEVALRCWSAGCASGEEPHTLSLLWHLCLRPRFPGLDFSIVATDANPVALRRAIAGCYGAGSLKDLPPDWLAQGFRFAADAYWVREECRHNISFQLQDIRLAMPEGRFHLILCRNLVLTYFDQPLRAEVMRRVAARLYPGGALVVGIHEVLPPVVTGLEPWYGQQGIYRKSHRTAGPEPG